jgi:hypothetical protein
VSWTLTRVYELRRVKNRKKESENVCTAWDLGRDKEGKKKKKRRYVSEETVYARKEQYNYLTKANVGRRGLRRRVTRKNNDADRKSSRAKREKRRKQDSSGLLAGGAGRDWWAGAVCWIAGCSDKALQVGPIGAIATAAPLQLVFYAVVSL